VAAARAVGTPIPSRSGAASEPETGSSAERAGLLTLLAVAVIFGLHSAIDWTWFFPGTALTALVCAGWLAGRGPLARPVGRVAAPARRVAGPVGRVAAPVGRVAAPVGRVAAPATRGARVATAGITALALAAAWAIWQPLRSADAQNAAITASSASTAIADARTAAARDPVSVDPLWELSFIYKAAGNARVARFELERAVRLQPANPATWLQLGEYDLDVHQPRAALAVLEAALYLDPHLAETLSAVAQARAGLTPPRSAPDPAARAAANRGPPPRRRP
jgi:hypothetical protein